MFQAEVEAYLDRFRGRPGAASRLSEATRLLERLLIHLTEAGINDWREVNSRVLIGFVAQEARGQNQQGRPIAANTLRHRFWLLLDFLAWLVKTGRIFSDLRANLVLPKPPGRLPRVPSEAEMPEAPGGAGHDQSRWSA
jgi:site-specific recombinase XerC